jgi:hypothetical protein
MATRRRLTADEVHAIIRHRMEPNEQARLFFGFLQDPADPIGRRILEMLNQYQRRINDLEKMAGFGAPCPDKVDGPLHLPPPYRRTDDKKDAKRRGTTVGALKQTRRRKRKHTEALIERYVDHMVRTNPHIEKR